MAQSLGDKGMRTTSHEMRDLLIVVYPPVKVHESTRTAQLLSLGKQ